MGQDTPYPHKSCWRVYERHKGHDYDSSIVVRILVFKLEQLLIGTEL